MGIPDFSPAHHIPHHGAEASELYKPRTRMARMGSPQRHNSASYAHWTTTVPPTVELWFCTFTK